MNDELKARIGLLAKGMGIPLIGFASTDRWEDPPFSNWMPPDFFPQNVMPGTRTVIVIGLPVTLPILETTPSVLYHELYKTINGLLDQYTYRIALFLENDGHSAVCITRDGYASLDVLRERPIAAFSHRHAAYLAGLGMFGVNNTLLTKRFGPRVRFASILTNVGMEPDGVMKENLCVHCMRCVEHCPVSAIEAGDYPEHIIDKGRCTGHNLSLSRRGISPCGVCIKVCPVGEDRAVHGRTDMTIYDGNGPLDDSWKHVRSYGSK
ncbi:MAG: 4Fe-4S dicluster domain-containing protein [Methanomassiliicoccales archaeon]|jgi:epoxyqueuosine reductase QueG